MDKPKAVALGEVIKPRREKVLPSQFPNLPFVGMEHVEAHTMRLLGTVPADTMRSNANRFYKGDVLYGRLRPYLNKVYQPNFDGLCSSEFIVLPKTDGVEPDFLKYQLNSHDFMSFASHLNTGDRPRVDFDQLSSFELILPSYFEQQRTVAAIETQFSRLDEAVTALKRIKANLKRYKAAVLKAAVEGKLVTFEQKKWKTTTVGEVSEVVTKGSSPNWQGFEYSSEGVVFVRSQNVSWGHLDLSDVAHLPLAFNKKEKKSVLKTGDVLLNIVGASIGRAAVATKSIEGGNVNQAVAVIRPLRDRLLPHFLMCYFLSEKVQKLIHFQKVDVARANYSLDQIRKLPLHLPPLDDQHRIVEEIESRLSITEEIEEAIDVNLKRTNRLRQAILKQAFSGHIT